LLTKLKNIFSSEYGAKKSATIYLIASFSSFGISILTLPLFTRLMTPEDFGKTLIFLIFGKLIVGFVNFNLHYSTYRYYFDYKNNISVFKSLNSTNLLFLLICFFISLLLVAFFSKFIISHYYKNQMTEGILLLSLLSGFLDYFFLYFTTILTALQKPVSYAFVIILNSVLNVIFSIWFIISLNLSYIGRIYGIVVSQIIMLFIIIIICRKTLTLKFKFNFLKKSLKLTSPMIPQMILGISQNYLDKSLLSYKKGVATLGFYSLGLNFSNILKVIMDSIEKAWSPFFFKNAQENTVKSKNVIANAFMTLAYLYMTVGIGVIYFSEEAIKLLTTKEYYPAIYVVPVYVYYYLFAIFGYIANAQLSLTENMKYILPGSIAGCIVNIIFNIILISKFGAIGAAISAAITALISNSILFYFGMKFFPLPFDLKKIVSLYVLLLIFTLFAYLIISSDLNLFLKILIKISMILCFVLIGFWKKILTFDHLIFLKGKNVFFDKLIFKIQSTK
jgi:O-antigen/teichoic acid export membrane protein